MKKKENGPMSEIREPFIDGLVLFFLWVLCVSIVNPAGNFPLDDDWNSGLTVYRLVTEGRYLVTPWLSSSLFAQALWGALFSFLFGFSFTALRFSTLFLGFCGGLGTYLLLKQIKAPRALCLIGGATLLFNPVYFNLCHTFRTDIPFFTFALFAFLFFIKSFNKNEQRNIIWATAFSVLATLTRQVGLVVPAVFCVIALARAGIRVRDFLKAVTPLVICLGALLLYRDIFLGYPITALLQNPTLARMVQNFSSGPLSLIVLIFHMAAISLIYVGLFLLPFLAVVGKDILSAQPSLIRKWAAAVSVFFFLALMGFLVRANTYMPLWGNTLNNWGLGPRTLRDIMILRLNHWPQAPILFWVFVTVMSVLGASFLIFVLFALAIRFFNHHRKESFTSKDWILIFSILTVFVYFFVIGIAGLFDRYLIFFIPFAMCILQLSRREDAVLKRYDSIIAGALIFLLAVYAVLGTHDYLSWNRARWQALNHLMQNKKVLPRNIDGGYEFNGWFTYQSAYRPPPDKSWWWVIDDSYLISFGPVEGYASVETYPFARYMPYGRGEIWVLKKR